MKFHGLCIEFSFIVDFRSITMGRIAPNLIVTTPQQEKVKNEIEN